MLIRYRLGVPLAFGLLLAGCGAGRVAAIREQAAVDLPCTVDKVGMRQVGNVEYVEGCGEIARYSVHCNVFGYCPSPRGEVISRLVRHQAAFDLNCGADRLELSLLNADTFGVRGCGRRSSYLVLDCHRGTCRVVQNTQR